MQDSVNKLPQVTLAFWVMKICATTLGETAGDLLSMTLNIGYAISAMLLLGLFAASLAAQLTAKRHHSALFWLVILTTSTAGTTISDYIDRTLGLGYAQGSAILFALLGVIFFIWYRTGHSFSVSQIRSRKVETLYWLAILVSNTLGTAFGDYLADSSGLGFGMAALLIAGVILLLVAAYYTTRISHVLLFWAAFVLTRPLGATVGDLLTKSHEKGGLDLGTMGSSAVLLAVLVILVSVTTRRSAGHAAH